MPTPTNAPKPAAAPKDAPQVPFKVEATHMGYYGDLRRRPGDVFIISGEKVFSKRWMRRVDERTPESTTTGNQALRKEHDELMSQKSSDPARLPTIDKGDNVIGDE